jgi:S-adenosylmethionine hydrolase
MSDAIITLTTDFGEASPYVGAMKGVILSLNPSVRILDLSHRIPPQDVRHAAFFLQAAVPYFPADVIHVVVVDPGVGTERALLYVEVNSQRLLAPDNGCWTSLARAGSRPPAVFRLTEPRYWRHPVSSTFHGRDILAPAAAHLSLGVAPSALGVPVTQWVQLEDRRPVLWPDGAEGEVIFVDEFGNLLTNIPAEALSAEAGRRVHVRVEGREIVHLVKTYAEAAPGTPVALVSSLGTLEVAVTRGSAAACLQAQVGTSVSVWSAGSA